MIVQSIPYPSSTITGDYVLAGTAGGQSVSGTDVLVTFDSVVRGSSSMFSDADDRVIAPRAGLARLIAGNTPKGLKMRTFKNGAAHIGASVIAARNVFGSTRCAAPSTIQSVAANDYFTLRASGTDTVDTLTYLGLEMLDPATEYAVATKSGTQAIAATTDTTITFDTEQADTSSIYAGGNSVVVPTGATLVRVQGCAEFTALDSTYRHVHIKKAGGFFSPGYGVNGERGVTAIPVVTAPLAVTAGDTFTMVTNCGAASTVAGSHATNLQLEVLSPSLPYVLLGKTTNQAGIPTTGALITFNASALHDPLGAFNGTSKVIVPAGYTKARASFMMYAVTSNTITVASTLNGAEVDGGAASSANTTSSDFCNAIGDWFTVAQNDEIALTAFTNTGTATLTGDAYVWFCVEFG